MKCLNRGVTVRALTQLQLYLTPLGSLDMKIFMNCTKRITDINASITITLNCKTRMVS